MKHIAQNRFARRSRLTAGFLAAGLFAAAPAGAARLLILGVDGCRPDALLRCRTPNLTALAGEGAFTWWALSRPPTKSGPCWSTIFTGVWNGKHGVTDNTFANSRFDLFPMLFRRLKDADPAFSSGWFVYWAGLNTAMPHAADVSAGDGSDERTVTRATDLLTHGDPTALFVQLGAIDAEGHSSGFDPDNPSYRNAIETADGRVGEVLAAMRARPRFAEEDWMVIALTDHGGLAAHHGGSTLEEMRTFFIVSGGGIPKREIGHRWVLDSRRVPETALRLDGHDGCVSAPDRPGFHFGTGGSFTVECCVRTGGWSGLPALISNKDGSNDRNRGFSIDLIDEGKWRVNAADGANRTNVSGPVIADGRWHHIAAVFERGGRLVLMQDGIRTGAADWSGIGSVDGTSGLSIGQDALRGRPAFAPVDVSEVRVWAAALPDSVVRTWMFRPVDTGRNIRPAAGDHPFIGALSACWRMNDGSGTTALDSGPHGADGSLIGAGAAWIATDDTAHTLDFDASEGAKTADMAVTALRHLGLPVIPLWNLDGKDWAAQPDTSTSVRGGRHRFAAEPGLDVHPNPFRGSASADLVLPETGRASLILYDMLGRRIRTVWSESGPAGRRRLAFTVEGLPSGVYVLVLKTDRSIRSRKIVRIE
jgi:hypothetical protein